MMANLRLIKRIAPIGSDEDLDGDGDSVGDSPAENDDTESLAESPRTTSSGDVRYEVEGQLVSFSDEEVVEPPKIQKKKKKHRSAHIWEG